MTGAKDRPNALSTPVADPSSWQQRRAKAARSTRRESITMTTKQRTIAGFLGLALTFSGLACTSTPKTEENSTPMDEGSTPTIEPAAPRPDLQLSCFNVRNVRRYSALHERYVYVRVRNNEHYLLTLERPCMGLEFATGIAISNDFSRVCSDTLAFITFQDGGRLDRCTIVRVEAVADKAMAERVVKNRTTPKPE
jgi:hypothetical protein